MQLELRGNRSSIKAVPYPHISFYIFVFFASLSICISLSIKNWQDIYNSIYNTQRTGWRTIR
jgi:hypothetical protein